MSKNSNKHHLVPHEDGWAIKRANSKKASCVFPTKKEAEKAGRKISRNQGTEFVIHKKNGQIQRSDSHGNDDYPPKG